LGEFSFKNAKKHPRLILDYMEKNGYSYKIHNYKHRYPACWRCKTELVWKVAEEWYIAMDKPSQILNSKSQIPNKSKIQNSKNKTLRQRMMEVAKKIKWMPEFGLDRELDWLKNMHDWLISKKNRYWGLSLPIYECKKCGHFTVIGSKEELKEKAFQGWEKFEGYSPHKPYIDEVKIKCERCKAIVSRIDDVGNPWLDAGIVAYSTITENNQGEPLYKIDREKWRKWFPADFITESFPGQFKNWFYSLIAMSTVLENTNPFRRVLGFATLLGEDGRPMHKSWGNAIEFNEGADKIGVDVMRWMYARQNPAENMLFGYKKADEVRRQFYLMLWNVYNFFVEYANLDKFQILNSKSQINSKLQISNLSNILDKWILSRFAWLVDFVEKSLKNFDARSSALEIERFVSDLSTWYIRRSRERVWVNSNNDDDKQAFYSTMYFILVNLSIILSPFLPFLSEEIYTNLTGGESVHLEFWPHFAKASRVKSLFYDKRLEEEMIIARKIVEAGHAKRKEMKVKTRFPLREISLSIEEKTINLPSSIWQIILQELNVKNIIVNKKYRYPKKEVKVSEEELQKEGELRELLRKIQAERKNLGLKPTDEIILKIPKKFIEFIDEIKIKTRVKKIIFDEKIEVLKN